jgi:hypothetical protein
VSRWRALAAAAVRAVTAGPLPLRQQSSWGWLSLAVKARGVSWWTSLGQVSENGGNAIVPAVALVVGAFTRTFHKPWAGELKRVE